MCVAGLRSHPVASRSRCHRRRQDALETARLDSSLQDADFDCRAFGSSVFLGADTPLGPAYVAVRQGDGWRTAGRVFREAGPRGEPLPLARDGGVEGKRVSVRVTLGGRRGMKIQKIT